MFIPIYKPAGFFIGITLTLYEKCWRFNILIIPNLLVQEHDLFLRLFGSSYILFSSILFFASYRSHTIFFKKILPKLELLGATVNDIFSLIFNFKHLVLVYRNSMVLCALTLYHETLCSA